MANVTVSRIGIRRETSRGRSSCRGLEIRAITKIICTTDKAKMAMAVQDDVTFIAIAIMADQRVDYEDMAICCLREILNQNVQEPC